ncbi:hypothetical protein WJX73_009321 [Symbiochloris irregularis]|uniref:Amino acid transporter n=1 Tax=Symbiochloris irregularis TaxID=706552 RepID=A0AAW1PN13_9CHLO
MATSPLSRARSETAVFITSSVEKNDDSQDALLTKLGLKQEFKREFNLMVSFGVSFCIISPLTRVGVGFTGAWISSGPAAAVWGFKIVSLLAMCIGLSMAEIVSGLPSSGGPYFWSSWLGGKYGPYLSWVTGWFNLLGQVSTTAAVAACGCLFVQSMLTVVFGIPTTQVEALAIYVAFLLVGGLINSCPPRWLARSIAFGVFVNIAGVIFLVLLMTTVAPWHTTPKFVWGTFLGKYGAPLPPTNSLQDNVLLFAQGCAMSTFVFLGYDSSAHVSQETRGADSAVPYAIILAVAASSIVGYVLILGLLFNIQNPYDLLTGEAKGFTTGQIIVDVFKARYGTGKGVVVAYCILILACTLCVTASLCANSRMIFAFARDKGLPFSAYFKHVGTRARTPIRALWLAVAGAFVMGLPILANHVASLVFGAVISVCTLGVQVSYGIPILCRLTISRGTFKRGPFHLGRYSDIVGWLAILYVVLSSAIFSLPASYPVTVSTLNYTPLALGVILLGCTVSWFFPKPEVGMFSSPPILAPL